MISLWVPFEEALVAPVLSLLVIVQNIPLISAPTRSPVLTPRLLILHHIEVPLNKLYCYRVHAVLGLSLIIDHKLQGFLQLRDVLSVVPLLLAVGVQAHIDSLDSWLFEVGAPGLLVAAL